MFRVSKVEDVETAEKPEETKGEVGSDDKPENIETT